MSNMLKYDCNRAKVLLLRHTNQFTSNDLITERRICMKKVLRSLKAFIPLFVVIGIVLASWVLQTFKVGNIVDWIKGNWIEMAIAYTLGVCVTKLTSKPRVEIVDDED